MNDNLKQLLKGAGYSDDVISKSEEKDFNVQEAVSAIEETNKARFKELFENSSYKEEIEKARDGHWFGDLRTQLKKFGIKPEELKDDMKAKDMFALLRDKTKAETEAAVGKAGEEVTKLQTELLDWKNKHTELSEQTENKIKEVLNQAKAEVTKEKVDYKLRNSFTAIPTEKILGNKHSDGLFMALKNVMDSKYDSTIDETGNPVFYVKGKQSKPEGKVDGKERILTSDELLMTELKGLGFIVESNGGGAPPKKETIIPGGRPEGQKSARVIEMEKRILEKQANG